MVSAVLKDSGVLKLTRQDTEWNSLVLSFGVENN